MQRESASALGGERDPCRGGSACDPGLTCLSDRCVKVPDVHCAAVVDALVSIELGNYAPVAQRTARAAELRPTCEALALGDADAACIVAARTRAQLAACPQPILMPAAPPLAIGSGAGMPLGLPPDCVAYVAILDRYAACAKLPAEARKAMQDVIVQLKHNWAGLGSAAMPPAVGDACRQGTAAIQQGMASFGC